jgi:ABC-type lipoprotein release transport system permease subunit
LTLAGIGVAVGVVLALPLTRLLRVLLFGISDTDPVTFVWVSVLLLLVATAACYIPARRAVNVDPVKALQID